MAEKLCKANNLAARIEEGVSHVECDKALSNEEIFQRQNAVNQAINDDLVIKIDFYNQEEGKKLGLPDKAFTHEVIRVVTIEGLDVNPCGGTHPKSTKEVEKCVITGTKEVRGAFRIYYKFGKRAVENRFETFSTLQKDRKSKRLHSSHIQTSRMPSSA